jgi:hypothetical protein
MMGYALDAAETDYFAMTPAEFAIEELAAYAADTMIPAQGAFIIALRRIAIRGLGFDPDEPHRRIVFDDHGNILWTNQHGSYISRRAAEHA